MKIQLGCLTFILSGVFAGGLFLTLVGNAWFTVSGQNALIGFFGFGIPMVVASLGTLALWCAKKNLLKTVGWTSTVIGLAHGMCLFILVAGWVLSDNSSERSKSSIPKADKGTAKTEYSATGLLQFFGFGIPMVLCGGFGIAMLFESERKDEQPAWPPVL